MATQTVATDTLTAVLTKASELTDTYGDFTVAQVVTLTERSETTVRAAVRQLVADGAVVNGTTRGWWRVVTTKVVDADGEHAGDDGPEFTGDVNWDEVDEQRREAEHTGPDAVIVDELADGTKVTTTVTDDATTSITTDKPVGYHVYAYGAKDELLRLRRLGTWVLTSEQELANFKALTDAPVSGWAGDKRRAVKELRVYVSGSALDSPAVAVLRPQELKRAREAATV